MRRVRIWDQPAQDFLWIFYVVSPDRYLLWSLSTLGHIFIICIVIEIKLAVWSICDRCFIKGFTCDMSHKCFVHHIFMLSEITKNKLQPKVQREPLRCSLTLEDSWVWLKTVKPFITPASMMISKLFQIEQIVCKKAMFVCNCRSRIRKKCQSSCQKGHFAVRAIPSIIRCFASFETRMYKI